MQEKLQSQINVAIRFRPLMAHEETAAKWKITESKDQAVEIKLIENKKPENSKSEAISLARPGAGRKPLNGFNVIIWVSVEVALIPPAWLSHVSFKAHRKWLFECSYGGYFKEGTNVKTSCENIRKSGQNRKSKKH